MSDEKKDGQVSRRSFLKVTGATAAVAGSAGLGLFGYAAGKDPMSYTGCEIQEGGCQTFNREKYAVDVPTYGKKVGESRRIDARYEMIFSRSGKLRGALGRNFDAEEALTLSDEQLIEQINAIEAEPLKKFYLENPENFKVEVSMRTQEFRQQTSSDRQKYSDRYILANAWSSAMGAVSPSGGVGAPEEFDFGRRQPMKLKSPDQTAKLIKMISHQLGSVLVGITKLNPDWVYGYSQGGRGIPTNEPFEVPKHWEYAIVVGVPMSWDPTFANPNFGTSNDAYSRSRIIAYRVAAFIKSLGYAARPHTPGTSYDLMAPPILVDAGIGEQGRHSVVITPELGANFRPAIITTNIPMKTDKPIDFGVQSFCKKCKICADQCPSGAISEDDGPVLIRGYKRWALNDSKCHKFWSCNLGPMGCRICVACCPYSRKSNWLHKTALQVTANDPTGLSQDALTKMQEVFYPGPDKQDYYMESMDGKNASYRKPPWWLKTEDFIDL